jgi:CheY-like chemotaxis protein
VIANALVVDDSPLNRKMLCKLLRRDGFHCEEAEDGLKAVQLLELTLDTLDDMVESKERFDVVLMDYMMPIMNGPTAATAMRKLGYRGPIIGITGNVMEADLNTFLMAGASIVLGKPLDINRIRIVLKRKLLTFRS